MVESLNTFLTTGKNKRIGGQKHACGVLGLETNGIAEVIRRRLLSYVDGDAEKEHRVRQIITSFVGEGSTDDERAPDLSQPPLFSQEENFREKEDEAESKNDESSDDDDEGSLNESRIVKTATSTPRPTAESLANKIKGWIGKTGVVPSKDTEETEDAIDFIEKSFHAMSIRNGGIVGGEEDDGGNGPASTAQEEGGNGPTKPDVIDLTSQSEVEGKYNVFIQNTFKIIEAKDAQIETLEHYLSQKESVIVRLEEMNKSLVGKVDDVMSFQTQKVDDILSKIENMDKKDSWAETTDIAQKLLDALGNLEKNNERVSKSVQELERRSQALEAGNETANPGSAKWQTECQQVMLQMAEKMENIEKIVGETQKQDEIMIMSDSNGKHIDPKKIHHQKKVTMEHIYTLDKATKTIPTRANPESVTDIVFMTGLNDSKDHRTSVEEVVNRQKEACHKYHHRFKNARFHIVAVAPESHKQQNLNKRLSEYATSAGISFVDNDLLFDEQTGDIKPEMLNEYHYTPAATAIIAKQLKRSLYGSIPQVSRQTRLAHQQNQPQMPPNQRQNPQPMLPNRHMPVQQRNNTWQHQNHQPAPTMQQNPTAIDDLLGAMGSFLQKWQTQTGRNY